MRKVTLLIDAHRAEFPGGDPPSKDALCLALVTLASLARLRFRFDHPFDYREQLRRLLSEHCIGTFTERVSVPELRQSGKTPATLSAALNGVFAESPPGTRRYPEDDPTIADFDVWLVRTALTVKPDFVRRFTYSSLIYYKYRNPIIHGWSIADGDEPQPPIRELHGDVGVFYYKGAFAPPGRGQGDWFGITDSYGAALAREAIESVKQWVLATRPDLNIITR